MLLLGEKDQALACIFMWPSIDRGLDREAVITAWDKAIACAAATRSATRYHPRFAVDWRVCGAAGLL
jgi:hypothetical protein